VAVFFKLIISIVLLIGIINLKMAWMIIGGWKYKNAEPDPIFLVVNRIGFIIMLLFIRKIPIY
jgi:hypothetical protein